MSRAITRVVLSLVLASLGELGGFGGLATEARAQPVYREPGANLGPYDPVAHVPRDAAGFAWETHSWPWVVSCWDPADREGTLRSFNPMGPYGIEPQPWFVHLVVDPAEDSVLAFEHYNGPWPDPTSDLRPLHIFRFRCADLLPGAFTAPEDVAGMQLAPEVELQAPSLTTFPFQGGVCFTSAQRVACLDAAALRGEAPLEVRERVHSDELEAALAPDPAWEALTTLFGQPPEYESWTISAVAAAGDRLFFIATKDWASIESSPQVRNHASLSWLVESKPGGVLDVRVVGVERSPLMFPLAGLGMDALAVVADDSKLGFGLQVVPIDRPGIGFLSFAHAFEQLHTSDARVLERGPDGIALLTVVGTFGARTSHAAVLVPGRIDLDDDGLSLEDETALGTSDVDPDSDDGGTSDGLERFAGTDPRDPDDDPARRDPLTRTRPALTLSPLIQMGTPSGGGCVPSASMEGPLCCGGACVDRRGGIVARYDAATAQAKSPDGTFLLHLDAQGIERQFLDDGRREDVIARVQLDAYVPDPNVLVPVDRRRTWIARTRGDGVRDGVVAYLADGSAPRLVYDHRDAIAASNDGTLPPFYTGTDFVVVGWHAPSERIFIAYDTSSDSFLVALSGAPGAEPELVVRGRAFVGASDFEKNPLFGVFPVWPDVPKFLFPTRDGYVTTGDMLTSWLEPAPTWFGRGLYYDTRLSGAWGDTMVDAATGYEVVQYDRARVDPGDILIAVYDEPSSMNGGAMLYKSGPRGGMVPLWPAVMPDITSPEGMSYGPDGRLCIADGGEQRGRGVAVPALYELEPARAHGAPEIPIDVIDLEPEDGKPLDCAYDAEGRLVLLTTRALMRRPALGGALETIEELRSGPAPEALVEGTAGTDPRVQTAADGVRGQVTLRDGRTASIARGDMTLRIDGTAVAELNGLISHNFREGITYPVDFPADVLLAERPDGRIMVFAHRIEVAGQYAIASLVLDVDPRTGALGRVLGDERGPYGIERQTFGGHHALAVAQVPGGSSANPWGTSPLVVPAAPGGVDAPAVPSAPSGGETVEVAGCGAVAVHADLAGLLAALGVVAMLSLARSRRRA